MVNRILIEFQNGSMENYMYRILDPSAIVSTANALKMRVDERFPDRGIARVSADVAQVAFEAKSKAEWIARPLWYLRLIVAFLIVVMVVVGILAVANFTMPSETFNFPEFVQLIESGINDLILLGAGLFFLITIENRIKRNRALAVLHELRSLAHVIDMHQLKKDPERLLKGWLYTASSPVHTMSMFELHRYLDYCSELLSILGKIAALYIQEFDDPVVQAAVNEIEALTTGLSRKIWQKIMIIRSLTEEGQIFL